LVFPSVNTVDFGRSLPIFLRVPCPKLLVVVDGDVVLLLRLMEKREGEDGDGGGGWRNTLVFATILSQNINFRDKILLPGKIRRSDALT